MAIPSSPPVSLSTIAAEYGDPAPYSLSSFLGKPGAPTAFPASMSQWYGLSNSDYTPNAVNWADINSLDARFGAINPTQTISGISPSIVLRPTLSGFSTTGILTGGVIQVQSDFNFVDLWTYNGGPTNNTITVSDGATVNFYVQIETTFTNPVSVSCTVSVVNTSDGNTSLDTFTISAQSPAGGGGGPGDP